MSTTPFPTTAGIDIPRDRFVEITAGLGALVFVALLIAQNIVRSTGPGFDADPAMVTAYFSGHRVAAVLPLVLYPIGMVALLAFAAGMRSLARAPRDRFWSALGTLAVAVLAGLFGVVNVIEIAVAVAGRDLAAAPHVVVALWAVHAAAFGLNLAAIAIALVALSRVASSEHLIPRALAIAAIPGAACLLAGALSTVAIAGGSPVLYLGLVGFLVWGVFLVVGGINLLRRRPDRSS
jgi:hypothetical protein